MSVVKKRNNGTNIRFFAKYKVVDSEVFGQTCFCLGLLKQKKLTANLSGLLRQEKENREFVVLLSVLNKVPRYCLPLVVTLGLIFFTNPCNTLPGPNSTNSVAPSATIFSTDCVHFTGAVS